MSRERCLTVPGATIGGSPSCYDACPPREAYSCTSDQDADRAVEQAKQSIAAAQGRPFDITDPKQVGLLLLQTPHELHCYMEGRVTKDFSRRSPQGRRNGRSSRLSESAALVRQPRETLTAAQRPS